MHLIVFKNVKLPYLAIFRPKTAPGARSQATGDGIPAAPLVTAGVSVTGGLEWEVGAVLDVTWRAMAGAPCFRGSVARVDVNNRIILVDRSKK